ncbi:MAG: recombination-associated protein RdgC [Deltaproteobacteria bacterium]|nr:recombination-associated protein RdgC [Deltaproteobacteria bacterium]
MGILANKVSLCQFQVMGDIPEGDLFEWSSESLAKNGFTPIDNRAEESSVGWVHLDDMDRSSFDTPRVFWRDKCTVFSLRRDVRKIPSVLFKSELERASREFLAANPTLRRVPKGEKESLREAVRSSLYSKTLPSPATYDVVWDRNRGIVTFSSLSPRAIDTLEALFKETFEGLRLVMIHPFKRAEGVIDEASLPLLAKANGSSADDVISLIKGNLWLGRDFLLWLMYKTMTDSSFYKVNQPGHFMEGEEYVAYLNDRLILKGESEIGVQKITVAGPQDNFEEVRTAVKNGKAISEAAIIFEKEEDQWSLTLKGDLFHFASFKSPAVRIEKDELTDAESEKEAVFYERIYLVEKGLQLFNSLYSVFLRLRLSSQWADELKAINEWTAGGEVNPS